jgi:hypothetical protein
MRRFRERKPRPERADAADARELLDLATRLGMPPEEAARHVSQLVNEAKHDDADRARTPT